ncbi:MAG: alpha-hydroxy-acid oxidizing protein [Chloroflexota bacterium]|nr:alpha-hydroxy-acid oxidizing protein [Chloroflexota bacterium]
MPLINVDDYRHAARRKLPRSVFDFVDSGAGDEGTTRANEQAFRAIKFRPRHMVDVSGRHQGTTVLGREIAMPVILGPAAPVRIVHRDGELAAARAAGRMGTIYSLSTGGSCSIEEVADAARGTTLWFQVYMWRSRDLVRQLVERADRAGYHAIILTIDSTTPALRDRDLRNGLLTSGRRPRFYADHARLSLLPRLTVGTVIDALRHPEWLFRHYLFAPPIVLKNVTAEDSRYASTSWAGPALIQKRMSETATWDEVRFLREIWKGPLIVKAVLTAEDAAAAFDHGADAVIVSNHGGRHLDGLPATVDVLPRVMEVADKRGKEVLLDGGVRRGIDVVKAVALGARACLFARPYFWALSVAGEDGVVALLEMLKKEIDSAIGALGRRTLADLDTSVLDFTVAPWHQGYVRLADHLRHIDIAPASPVLADH